MDEKKLKSTLTFWAVVLGVLQGGLTILNYIAGNTNVLLGGIIAIILIILFIVFSFKKIKVGPIFGIILSLLYITSLDVVSVVVGVLLILDCIKILKYFKNN